MLLPPLQWCFFYLFLFLFVLLLLLSTSTRLFKITVKISLACDLSPYSHVDIVRVKNKLRPIYRRIENIVPPLGRTGCEDLGTNPQRKECEGRLRNITIIVISVASGVILFAGFCLILITVLKWIRAVRPAATKSRVDRAVELMRMKRAERGWWVRDARHIQSTIGGKQELADEEHGLGVGASIIAPSIEEKGFWFWRVKLMVSWDRKSIWKREVLQSPGRGVGKGMLTGLYASDVVTKRAAGDQERCEEDLVSAISMASKGRDIVRTASSSRETDTEERATSLRKRSGQGKVGNMP